MDLYTTYLNRYTYVYALSKKKDFQIHETADDTLCVNVTYSCHFRAE